jgi:predicted protein tyrosine phosphatase
MKTILFVCARNRLRSPTAEVIFANMEKFEVSSAGINRDANNPLTSVMVEAADIIFVMDQDHRRKLGQRFRQNLRKARLICLDIPDDYAFMDPELIALLRRQVRPHRR